MNGHPSEERLNDYVDGLLDRRAEATVEGHLEGCPECRETLERTRRVVGAIRQLPKAIAPRRDLWEDVEDATRPVRPLWRGAPGLRKAAPWRRTPILAAAAVLLVAVTAAITVLLVRPTPETGPPMTADAGTTVVATPAAAGGDFGSTEAEYLRTTARMLQALEARREGLAPETRAAIDASLRDIDAAIQRLREALTADPASAELIHMLDDAYRWKIDVLRRAIRAART